MLNSRSSNSLFPAVGQLLCSRAIIFGVFLAAQAVCSPVLAQQTATIDSPDKALKANNTANAPEAKTSGLSAEQLERAVTTMRQGLEHQQRWSKVRAAECLISLDYPQGVAEEFGKQEKQFSDEPDYRIGIWRVLALVAKRRENLKQWVDKIMAVALDENATDRPRALQALGMLRVEIDQSQLAAISAVAEGKDGKYEPAAAYARWVLVNSGCDEGAERLAELLASDSDATRDAAAGGISRLRSVSPKTSEMITAAAERTPSVAIIAAAAAHGEKQEREKRLAQLTEYVKTGSPEEQKEACAALARSGRPEHAPLLLDLMDFSDADLQVAASWAACKVDRRRPRQMSPIDWAIIAAYALGMIGIGWYYSRRTANTEDYLLGGRNMRPAAVGLSLFATMLSTISYLFYPGEVIQNGPMYLCIVLGYPFVFLTVGYLIIPRIMQLRVTSAYEILETRLGLMVRMLGSSIFLLLRLLWMSVIIYATAGTVLVPLMGLDASATPYVCAAMGIITIIYTSMGGLRAVVLTDVVQTFILFGAAVFSVILISIYFAQHMGGALAWWPSHWAPHWQEPVFTFNPFARVSALAAILAMFTWHVCTNCSDQMAIQRYLATKDAKHARRVTLVALSTDMCVAVCLNILGLALLSFFRAQPHLLGDDQMIMANADQLFPRFIAIGLPVGVSGLVIAGLLAAAMSSLSSGINSSCSVISVDFIDRFRNRARRVVETDHVRTAKYIAVFVGLAVVVLSTFVCMVSGNLLEVAFKVVNLFPVPLAGIFMMALFVPWATAFGTIVGALTGLAVAVTINYFPNFTGGVSFLWAMPSALVVQMSVGMLVSILPIGRRACQSEGYNPPADAQQ